MKVREMSASHEHLDAVARVVRLFDYLMVAGGDVGVSELSRELGYSKSVIHRMLSTLRAYDYVAIDEETRKYRLSFRAMQLGLAAQSRIDIRRIALPRLSHIRAVTRETVNLSIRVGDRRVYIESLESPQELRQRVVIGQEQDLFLGSSGKAIMAHLPADDLERVLAIAEGHTTTAGDVLTRDAVLQDLSAIRQRGYAISFAERLAGTFSIAAPIFDHLSLAVASMSISGPTARWTDEMGTTYGALLSDECRSLSRQLGFIDTQTGCQPTLTEIVG